MSTGSRVSTVTPSLGLLECWGVPSSIPLDSHSIPCRHRKQLECSQYHPNRVWGISAPLTVQGSSWYGNLQFFTCPLSLSHS